MRDGSPEQAIRHFETALDLDSRTVPASLNLGDVYLSQGRTTEAIAMWEQISRTAPERSYLAFTRLETAYGQLDGPQRFVNLCRRLIDANPQDWRARLTLGQHFANRGDPTRALDLFFESLVHNPHALAVHQAIWRTLTTLDFDPILVRRYVELTHDAVFYLDPPRLHALPLPQHRAALAVPAVPRVEHLRGRADRAGGGGRRGSRLAACR